MIFDFEIYQLKFFFFETFRIINLVNDDKHSRNRQNKNIFVYFTNNENRFKNPNFVNKIIRCDIRLLVLKIKINTFLTSTFVCFCFIKFRKIKIENLSNLDKALNNTKCIKKLADERTT